MPKDRVLQMARGRIWTGEDAKALGLVDELGGFPAALRLAKVAAGVPEAEDVNIEVFPRKRGSLELLLDRLAQWGLQAEQPDASTGVLVRLLRMIQPVAGQLRSVIEEPGVLSMPPVRVRP